MEGKIAILSDVHANSWALESVVEDIRKRSPDYVLNLGDSLYGPLDPRGTFKLLQEIEAVSVSGNEDRLIVENLNNRRASGTLRFVLQQLEVDAKWWLRSLPPNYTINDMIYMCHGTPFSDSEYLIEEIECNRLVNKGPERATGLTGMIGQRIVLCGHSHLPGIIETGSKVVINPGSVGCPAYEDDHPRYHRVENFSPKARYCVIAISAAGIVVDHIALDYDYKAAASQASLNGQPDWAKWLITGCV